MSTFAAFLLGVVVGLIIGEFLPPDMTITMRNKFKKNNGNIQLDLPMEMPTTKRPGLLKRIFKRKTKNIPT